MKKIKVLIADDEEPAVSRVENLLKQDASFEIASKCFNGIEIANELRTQLFDVIIIDIEMPGMSGLDILNIGGFKKKPVIVFVTAYHEYAVQAFEYYALDYVLKPYSNGRFKKMLERVKEKIEQDEKLQVDWQSLHTSIVSGAIAGRVVVKTGKRHHFIDYDNIAYITADGNYCEIILKTGGRHVHRDTITHIASVLTPGKFIRIHHSHIISVDYVKQVVRLVYGGLEIVMKDGTVLKASRRYNDDIKKIMG